MTCARCYYYIIEITVEYLETGAQMDELDQILPDFDDYRRSSSAYETILGQRCTYIWSPGCSIGMGLLNLMKVVLRHFPNF